MPVNRSLPVRVLAALAVLAAVFAPLAVAAPVAAETPRSIEPAPPRAEGDGPYSRLVLRGGILIDGTGAPPRGPVDIVIEGNRIVDVVGVGAPGVPIDPSRRPVAGPGGQDLDISGMYVLPGLIDMHGHQGGVEQGTPAEYVYKLWMGHGVTTVRDPGCGNGLAWCVEQKRRSAANEITAPRIEAYDFFGQDRDEPFTTPEQAREWVREVAKEGADGLKFFGYRPDIMKAAIEEANRLGAQKRLPPRPARRGAGQRPDHRALGADHDGALVRPAGGAVRRPDDPGLPGRLQLQRRVRPLRPGRAPLGPGRQARERTLEPGDGRDARPRLHDRPDLHDLRGEPRPDARAPRGVARGVHPAFALGLLQPQPARPTAPTGTTGRPPTRSPGRRTTAAGWSSSTSTRTAAAG